MLGSGICLAATWLVTSLGAPASAESLGDALAKAYQNNPQLNAERARQRATTRMCLRRWQATGLSSLPA